MEQLVNIRVRLKAIETIRKITHAMRLISMSTHSRLKNRKETLNYYKKTFQEIKSHLKSTLKFTKRENEIKSTQYLIILVGSQKGLCGTFNSALFKFFESNYSKSYNDVFIGVGKNAVDYLTSREKTVIASFKNFNSGNFVQIAQSITNIIRKDTNFFAKIIIFSNKSKNFFIQEPQKSDIKLIETKINNDYNVKENKYIIEQPLEEIENTIENLTISITIQELLFDSLISEQAARFISMDAATKNADNLLQTMKLEYNKLRQASITRELTELTSGY